MRMGLCVLSVLALLGFAGCARGVATGAKRIVQPCPLEHGTWEPVPAFSDEFDGTQLDPAKWHRNNPGWKGRQPAFFSKKNVAVSDGQLHLTMRAENLPDLPKGYHTFTSAAVKSTSTVRYGYFEIKARPMNSKGSSAFWFYDGTPEVWTEIDVFEIGAGNSKYRRTVHMNVHVFHTHTNPDRHWAKATRWEAPADLADSFRAYGLEWDPEHIRFYIDGQMVHEQPNTHWHQPLTLNFDSETMPKWFGLPDAKNLPSTFSIEYVRAWRRLDGPADTRWKWCRFTFPGAKPAAVKGKTVDHRIATDGAGRLVVRSQFDGEGKPAKVKVAYDDAAFFAGLKEPKAEKTVVAKDTQGRAVRLVFSWAKHKAEKQNCGYRMEAVEIAPAEKPAAGATATYEFAAEQGRRVAMKLVY